ncbi:hypothetical protein YT1_2053 [Rhodococcus ruber]|nr:hypothetical protein YT1_2053 [Rhodococcus ruber]
MFDDSRRGLRSSLSASRFGSRPTTVLALFEHLGFGLGSADDPRGVE